MNTLLDIKSYGVPLYRQIREQLSADLRNGVWKLGDLLPSELELGERFGVSVGTVKQAILALVREGMLTRQPGKGTFVTQIDRDQSLARFFRFRESVSGNELHPQIRVIDVTIHPCSDEIIARKLGLKQGENILVVRRSMMQEDTPICLYTSYLPYALVKGLESADLSERTLYDILERERGIHIVRAEESLRAVSADSDSAKHLSLSEGVPLIVIERSAYTYKDVVVEWRKIAGRSDKFEYHLQLR